MIILAANLKISSDSLSKTFSLPAGVGLLKPCVCKWTQADKLNVLTTIFSIMWYTMVGLEMNQKHRKSYQEERVGEEEKENGEGEGEKERARGGVKEEGNSRINQSILMLASTLTCNDSLEVQVTLPYQPLVSHDSHPSR